MKLNAMLQADLITAANRGIDNINAMIQKLKEEYPVAFHTDTSVLTRVFFHRPAGDRPDRSFVRGSVQP
jgi:hypothetical protein